MDASTRAMSNKNGINRKKRFFHLFTYNFIEPDFLDHRNKAGRHFRQTVGQKLRLGKDTLAQLHRVEGGLFFG